jgi:hypothetical protein
MTASDGNATVMVVLPAVALWPIQISIVDPVVPAPVVLAHEAPQPVTLVTVWLTVEMMATRPLPLRVGAARVTTRDVVAALVLNAS